MLEFAAFSAQREIELQWATNTGYRNDYYIVEKSIDGATFETLSRVENEDLGDDVIAYNDIDPSPALGDNYYRIKQVYSDGSFDYTEIKHIPFNIDLENLSMYPNPVQEVLNFNLKPLAGKSATISIINNYGQVVQIANLDKVENDNFSMALSQNITNGFYQVFIETEGQKPLTKKLIIKRLY